MRSLDEWVFRRMTHSWDGLYNRAHSPNEPETVICYSRFSLADTPSLCFGGVTKGEAKDQKEASGPFTRLHESLHDDKVRSTMILML